MQRHTIILAASAFIGLTSLAGFAQAAEDKGMCPPYCSPGRGGGSMPDYPPPSAKPDYPSGPNVGQPQGNPDHPRRRHDRRWKNNSGWLYNDRGFGNDYYYAPRYRYNYVDPYYDNYGYGDEEYYIDQPVRRSSVRSCARAADVLRASGYRSIRATDCKGSTYAFRAIRNGKLYKVSVSARTGRIINRIRL